MCHVRKLISKEEYLDLRKIPGVGAPSQLWLHQFFATSPDVLLDRRVVGLACPGIAMLFGDRIPGWVVSPVDYK